MGFWKGVFGRGRASESKNDTPLKAAPNSSTSKEVSPKEPSQSQKKMLEAIPPSMADDAEEKWWGQFFECPKPTLDYGLCSDDNCPCDPIGVSIKRGEGYLYISKEVVQFRKDSLYFDRFEQKVAAMQSLALKKIGLPSNTRVAVFGKMGLPVLVCEQGARLRNLDLAVAHEDAKRWWDTGRVPLRTTPLSMQGNILRMFANHFKRVRAEFKGHQPTMGVLDEVESRFQENASGVAEMVEKTLADHKLHTKCVAGDGVRSWLLVSVVPHDRKNSAGFFAAEYPPGYGGYMNFWLNSEPFRQARQMGHDVFAHVLVYADASSQEKISLGFGLFPLNPSGNANPGVVMPSDSLTQEDRVGFGL